MTCQKATNYMSGLSFELNLILLTDIFIKAKLFYRAKEKISPDGVSLLIVWKMGKNCQINKSIEKKFVWTISFSLPFRIFDSKTKNEKQREEKKLSDCLLQFTIIQTSEEKMETFCIRLNEMVVWFVCIF